MRADRKRAGLLYAGTEYGMYISFDDGANWKKFQLNLPEVPITDLAIKENDLVVATQGRSLYVLDDLSLVQQMNAGITKKNLHLFQVNPVWRIPGAVTTPVLPRNAGANPPNGAVINYYLKQVSDTSKATLLIMNKDKKVIRSFATDAKEARDKFEINNGINQFVWNLRYPEAERIEGMILWNGVPGSLIAPPGEYSYRIKLGTDSADGNFTINADPNYKITQQEYDEQFAMLQSIQDKFNEVQKTIKDIRALRTQINDFTARLPKDSLKEIRTLTDSINKKLTAIEETLYQTKAKSNQDVLNYPIRINDKLSGLFDAANSGNMAPSRQVREVFKDLARQADEQINKFKQIQSNELIQLNELIRKSTVPVIGLKSE